MVAAIPWKNLFPISAYCKLPFTLAGVGASSISSNITSDIEESWNSVSTVNNGIGDTFSAARAGAFFNADISGIVQDNVTEQRAICYKDGSFRIGNDVYHSHTPGPNLQILFLAGGKYVVSTSSTDGTIVLHKVVVKAQ